jgi:hypothetical protein
VHHLARFRRIRARYRYDELFKRHRIDARHPDADDLAVDLETRMLPFAWGDDTTDHGVRFLRGASRVVRRGGLDIETVAAIIQLARLSDREWFDEIDRLLWELVAAILAHLTAPRNRAERRHGSRRDGAAAECATTRADSSDDDRSPAVMVRELVAAPDAPPRVLPV